MRSLWLCLGLVALLLSCTTPPRLTEEAYVKGLTIQPPYDVKYDLLWEAAVRAVQKLGFQPVNSYPENRLIQTGLRIQEDLAREKQIGTKVYIFFESIGEESKELYGLRICAVRYESPLDREQWSYKDNDYALQALVQRYFNETLEELYRGS